MKKPCKERSLAYCNPKLSKEWDHDKNHSLTPFDVTKCSGKKVWWKCLSGHSYYASISHRSNGRRCSYCYGDKVYKNNCLSATNLALSKEWNHKKNLNISPDSVLGGSNKKVWWICKKKHEWEATVLSRNNGSGCPYCHGDAVCQDNCLEKIYSKISKEWDYKKNIGSTPNGVLPFSQKKVWWICKKGHSYSAIIKNRTKGNSNCPYCSGHKVCKDNCLETVSPRLSKEWNYKRNGSLTPKDVVEHSNKRVWWICKHGHEWQEIINRRSGDGLGCPYCSKIELNDNTFWDSLPEAYYYLELKRKNIKSKSHVKIGLGKKNCDFYIIKSNTYVEITGYRKESWKYWNSYYKNILKKKNHVIRNLKAKFKFVQIKLTAKQIEYVRENSL